MTNLQIAQEIVDQLYLDGFLTEDDDTTLGKLSATYVVEEVLNEHVFDYEDTQI